jgi:hypothetical protein
MLASFADMLFEFHLYFANLLAPFVCAVKYVTLRTQADFVLTVALLTMLV